MTATTFVGERPSQIGLLYNPLSGTNRRDPAMLPGAVAGLAEVVLREVRTPAEVTAALAAFAARDLGVVAVSGGDGTVQAALTALYAGPARRPRPHLVALAAGTTNMIAGDVGHPGDQVWALRRLAHWLRTGVGRVVRLERQVLHLAVPGHGPQCGLFCGVGLISRGVGFYREHLHNRGLAGVPGIALTLVRAVGAAALRPGQQATPLSIRVDGRSLAGRGWLFLLVTTLDHLFFGLRPFWGDRHGPLRYTAVRRGAPRLLRLLPQLARGRAHPLGTAANGYFSGSGRDIRLFLDTPLALDGELFTPATATEPTVLTSAGRVHFLRVES